MPVIDLGDVVERQRLALGDKVELVVFNAIGPRRRTVMGVSGRLHHVRAAPRPPGSPRRCAGVSIAVVGVRYPPRHDQPERIGRGDRGAHDGTVGQVDVGEGDGAGSVSMSRALLPLRVGLSVITPPVADSVGLSLVPVMTIVSGTNVVSLLGA